MKKQVSENLKYATFAGGCFWCMEQPFESLEGVADVVAGYTGGNVANPGYAEVSMGITGHYEAIQITYDPTKVSYAELLEVFWRQIDPTDAGGQFVDRGPQYRTAIFYHDEEQQLVAEKSRAQLANTGRYTKPIVTQILPYTTFYMAEDYHQDYYKKNAYRYDLYKQGSGRADYLKKSGERKVIYYQDFKKPQDEELRAVLNPLQYAVTQQNGTEPAFLNEYWNNKKDGIYVDIVSGEPLFSSAAKYESGTGWPSFFEPLESANVVEVQGGDYAVRGVEVRSKHGDSHLGHVFGDGPRPTGKRYCMNSAALRFIPKEKLAEEGYSQYEYLFNQ